MIIKKKAKLSAEKTKTEITEVKPQIKQEEKIDLFDLDNIDFSQRAERRRGDRRRGYRRIDDRNLISRAQEEAGTIRDNAAKDGYKAGLEQAQKDIEQIKNALITFLNARNEVFEYIAPDILEISVDIARKIVKKEIEQNPELVLGTILDLLKTISKDETKLNLKINPAQVDFVKENIPSIIATSGLDVGIKIVADDTIDLGSCILYTSNGLVDATIDTQLEIIKETFKGL